MQILFYICRFKEDQGIYKYKYLCLTWHYAYNIDDNNNNNNNNNNYKNNNERWVGSNMLEVLHCFIFLTIK